jgi:hypothetical protein
MAMQAVGGEGDREFATIALRSATDTSAAAPADRTGPDPPSVLFSGSLAADPAIAVSIALVLYKLPPSHGVEGAEKSWEAPSSLEPHELESSHRVDDADWEGENGEEIQGMQWLGRPPAASATTREGADAMSASWTSLPVDPVPPSPLPRSGTGAGVPHAAVRGSSMNTFVAISEGVAEGRLPPPYVVTVHTRSGLVLQYSLSPITGGDCVLLGEFSADLVVDDVASDSANVLASTSDATH